VFRFLVVQRVYDTDPGQEGSLQVIQVRPFLFGIGETSFLTRFIEAEMAIALHLRCVAAVAEGVIN
jgi:hypothetical protein